MKKWARVWTTITLLQLSICFLFGAILMQSNQTDAKVRGVQASVNTTRPAEAVDYEHIDDLITKKIAALPKPTDGTDGKDGLDGKDGTNGRNGTDGTDGKDGKPGPQGEPGVDKQQVEIRANPYTHETEWRCGGDLLWTSLISNPILGSSCL